MWRPSLINRPAGATWRTWLIIRVAQPQQPIVRQLLAHHDEGPKKWAANATTGTIPLDFSDLSSRGQRNSNGSFGMKFIAGGGDTPTISEKAGDTLLQPS
eukprot:scaffold6988_cov33-Attheya_sp.AAC.1